MPLPSVRWSAQLFSVLWFALLFLDLRVLANSCISASTCTQCVKASKDCAWCTEPSYNSSARCDTKTNLADKCSHHHMYEPKTELRIPKTQNFPLGKKKTDGLTVTQLEPQQVQLKMKPGDPVEIPFKYEHRHTPGIEVQNFQIMTSSYKDTGVDVEFSIDCNGERKIGTLCPNIKDQQRVNFYVKLTLVECKNTALSISVYGYNTVSGIFVTPLCECECEKPRNYERRSPQCNHRGDLSCGVCKCDQGYGGRQCECGLSKHGVSSAEKLDDKCRASSDALVCSGSGRCECGLCHCNPNVAGDFCECDNTKCPINADGQQCSANGKCQCGKCECESGFTSHDCSCTSDPAPCTENGLVCSGNGECECGKCACNSGFSGPTCSLEQPSGGGWDGGEGEILPSDGQTSTEIRDRPPSNENIDDAADAAAADTVDISNPTATDAIVGDAQEQNNAAIALLINVHVIVTTLTLLLLVVLAR